MSGPESGMVRSGPPIRSILARRGLAQRLFRGVAALVRPPAAFPR